MWVAREWRDFEMLCYCVDVNFSHAEIDDDSSMLSNEPEVEYTEVVHPRSSDPTKSNTQKPQLYSVWRVE